MDQHKIIPLFVAFIPAESVSNERNIFRDFVYLESNLTCSCVIAVPQEATAFFTP